MGLRRGGGKEGGPTAFVGEEARLMVANGFTATLQLRGMAVDVRRRTIKGKGEVGQPQQCSSERKKVTTLQPFLLRGSGRKCSEAADWRRRRARWLSVRWVPREREESEGGTGGFLKPWRIGGAGQKKGSAKGGRGPVRVEGEGGRERGPWHGGQQYGVAGNDPQPSGAGGAIAERTGEGSGRGRRR
jgi:hypothetical protein